MEANSKREAATASTPTVVAERVSDTTNLVGALSLKETSSPSPEARAQALCEKVENSIRMREVVVMEGEEGEGGTTPASLPPSSPWTSDKGKEGDTEGEVSTDASLLEATLA